MDSRSERRARRVTVALPGRLRLRRWHDVEVLDLSASGCLLRCDARLDPGAILDIELQLPGPPLATRVKISEISLDGAQDGRFLAGAEFLGLRPPDEARLRQMIEEAARRPR